MKDDFQKLERHGEEAPQDVIPFTREQAIATVNEMFDEWEKEGDVPEGCLLIMAGEDGNSVASRGAFSLLNCVKIAGMLDETFNSVHTLYEEAKQYYRKFEERKS